MKMTVDISQALASVEKLSAAKAKAVSRALKVGGALVVDKMQENLGKGSTRGRAYRRRSVVHYASRAGGFPNPDTGWLKRSVALSRRRAKGAVFVVVGASYGKSLEFGRRFMAARPFVRPTVEQTKRRIQVIMTKALNNAR